MRPSRVSFPLAAALAAAAATPAAAQTSQSFASVGRLMIEVRGPEAGSQTVSFTRYTDGPGGAIVLRSPDGPTERRGALDFDVSTLSLPRVTSASILFAVERESVSPGTELVIAPVIGDTVAMFPVVSSLSSGDALNLWTDLADGTPYLTTPFPDSSPSVAYNFTVPIEASAVATLASDIAAAQTAGGGFGIGASLRGPVAGNETFTLIGATITLLNETRFDWTRNGSGAWSDAANWSLTVSPGGAFDTVTIASDRSLTVTGPGTDVAVEVLTVGGGRGLSRLALDGGEITVTAGALIETTGELTGSGTLRGNVTNLGTVIAEDVGVVGGTLTNRGSIVGAPARNARVDADVVNDAGGLIDVAPGERLGVTGDLANVAGARILVTDGALSVGGAASNAPAFTGGLPGLVPAAGDARAGLVGDPTGGGGTGGGKVEDPGSLPIDVTLRPAGLIQTRDARLTFSGGLANAGLIQTTGDFTDVVGDVTNLAGGLISAAAGTQLTFFDDLRNDGEVRTAAGARTIVLGAVSGGGAFTGDGTLGLEGGVSPGASPGLLEFLVDTDLGAGSVNLFELGGLARGLDYDALDVAGTLTLGGAFQATLLAPFVPDVGDVFELIRAEAILGDFASFAFPTLPGLDWRVLRSDTRFALEVTGAAAAGAPPAAAPVPVPAAAALLLSALGTLAAARRRRRRPGA